MRQFLRIGCGEGARGKDRSRQTNRDPDEPSRPALSVDGRPDPIAHPKTDFREVTVN